MCLSHGIYTQIIYVYCMLMSLNNVHLMIPTQTHPIKRNHWRPPRRPSPRPRPSKMPRMYTQEAPMMSQEPIGCQVRL